MNSSQNVSKNSLLLSIFNTRPQFPNKIRPAYAMQVSTVEKSMLNKSSNPHVLSRVASKHGYRIHLYLLLDVEKEQYLLP